MDINTLLWRFGCGSTLALIALGAKYGHTGRLDADGVSLFNKSQVYHMLTSTVYPQSRWWPSGSVLEAKLQQKAVQIRRSRRSRGWTAFVLCTIVLHGSQRP
jgi:hypothetical protein